MEVDGDVQRLGAFEDRPEEFVVEIASPAVAVDERSFEAVLDGRSSPHTTGEARGRSSGSEARCEPWP